MFKGDVQLHADTGLYRLFRQWSVGAFAPGSSMVDHDAMTHCVRRLRLHRHKGVNHGGKTAIMAK